MYTAFTIIKKILTQACISFTVMVLSLFLVASAFPGFGNAVAIKSIFSIFGFSILVACANLILNVKKIAIVLRVLLHYLACLPPFYLMFVLIVAQRTDAGAILSDFLFFTILYVLIMGTYLIFRASLDRALESKGKTYQSIYKK